MKATYSIFTLCLFILFVIFGIKSNAQEQKYSLEVALTQDAVSNMNGGIKRGQAFLGLIDLGFTIDTEKLNLWENGNFHLQIQNTYGQTPTKSLVGDIQVFSNIENGTYTYLYQLWYKHQKENFSFILGKHDMNEEFFTSELAGEYINSSFGIMPTASINVPVSIFPYTTLGLAGSYKFNETFEARGGIYNGLPGKITHSNFGTDLNLKKQNGLLYVGELHFHDIFQNNRGTYKMGVFHHSGRFDNDINNDKPQKGVSGLYFIADQMIFTTDKLNEQGLGTMLQAGYSPNKHSISDYYLAFGLNYFGVFQGNQKDMLGIAIAHASMNNSSPSQEESEYASCETAFEMIYKLQILNNLSIQPNIQYILHPGMKKTRGNALVGLLRIQWNYN